MQDLQHSTLWDSLAYTPIWEPAALYQFTNGQHVPGSTSDITINVDPDYFKDLDDSARTSPLAARFAVTR